MRTKEEILQEKLITYQNDRTNIEKQKKLLEELGFSKEINKLQLLNSISRNRLPTIFKKTILHQYLEERCGSLSDQDYRPLESHLKNYFNIKNCKIFQTSLTQEQRVYLTLLEMQVDLNNKEESLNSKIDAIFYFFSNKIKKPSNNNQCTFHFYIKWTLFHGDTSRAEITAKNFKGYFQRQVATVEQQEENQIIYKALFVDFNDNIERITSRLPASSQYETIKKQIKKDDIYRVNFVPPVNLINSNDNYCRNLFQTLFSYDLKRPNLEPSVFLPSENVSDKLHAMLDSVKTRKIIDSDDHSFRTYIFTGKNTLENISNIIGISIKKFPTSQDKENVFNKIIELIQNKIIEKNLKDYKINDTEKFYNRIRQYLGKEKANIIDAYRFDFNKILLTLGIDYQYIRIYRNEDINNESLDKIKKTFDEILLKLEEYIIEKKLSCLDFYTFTQCIFKEDYKNVFDETISFFRCLEINHIVNDKCINILNAVFIKTNKIQRLKNKAAEKKIINTFMSPALFFQSIPIVRTNSELTSPLISANIEHQNILEFLKQPQAPQSSCTVINQFYQTPELPNFSTNTLTSNATPLLQNVPTDQGWLESNLYLPEVQEQFFEGNTQLPKPHS